MNTKSIRRLLTSLSFIICHLAFSVALTSCDEIVSHFASPDDLDFVSDVKTDKQEAMQVHKIEFSPDYKTFTVTTRMYEDIGPYSLTDTTKLRIEVKSSNSGITMNGRSTPRLIGMRNVKQDNIAKKEVQVLALVDLTQPQAVLNRIHDHLIELRSVFNDANLHVSFIYGDSVGQTRDATNYVLDNYLIEDNAQYVMLYRSIYQKYEEMLSHRGPWATAKHMALLIFSDNEIYNNATDRPIDPEHYIYETNLTLMSEKPDPNIMVCYADMKLADNKSGEEDLLVIRHLCEQTRGCEVHPYNGTVFKNHLLQAFNISPDANEFVFENSDGKVYCGSFETLAVKFYSVEADTLVTSFKTVINKGNFYNPIIVHGLATPVIILMGIVLIGFIIVIVWLLLQFVIPFISYKLFSHKYVIRYAGRNMGFGKSMVAEACYLCKEPFAEGDEVVVKCSHTMHKSCWDENGYHCTEYSDRCKQGHHYYNSQNLMDHHNAPFYMLWVIAAILATTLAWIMFISRSHRVTAFWIRKLVCLLEDVEPGSPEFANLMADNAISPLPSFGFSMGLFMTLAIAILSTKLLNVRYNIWNYVLRSLSAAIICYTAYIVTNVIIIVSGLQSHAFLLEWIPWVFSACVISVLGTYRTRVKLRKKLILPTVIISILSMHVWWAFYDNAIDYRLLLLLGFLFFGIGLAVCIATVAPRSERYFLHMEGAVKEMDVALFKWFRNAPNRVVTIGKSLDCSIQMSWDISGSVAPVHAEIRLHHNTPYLTACEEGVIVNGKVQGIGEETWLHHGSKFTIANTTFTYIEKDL